MIVCFTFLICLCTAFDFLSPGPVIVDPSQVVCIEEAEIDKVSYHANVAQVYSSLPYLCKIDDCEGNLGSVGSLAGDMQIYNQDLHFKYEGKQEYFQLMVDKLVNMVKNDKRVYVLGGKQRFYKYAVVDCFSAKLTVITTGRKAVGAV